MKAMKKVFAMLLALVMVLGLSATAMAAEITVNGVAGQTYTAYKIFNVTKSTEPTSYKEDTAGTYYHNTTNDTYETTKDDTSNYEGENGTDVMYSAVYSYSYSISASDTAWLPVVLNYMGYTLVGDKWYATNDTTTAEGGTTVSTDAAEVTGEFTGKGLTLTLSADGSVYDVEATTDDADTTKNLDPAAFATYLLANKPASVNGASATAGTNGTAAISNLDAGYYLVDSSLGALMIMNTSADTVTVNEKNAEPTLAKTVKEDSTGVYSETATADMMQTVDFKLTVKTGSDSSALEGNYVITDTLPAGMTYVYTENTSADDGGLSSGLTVKTTSANSETTWSTGYSIAQDGDKLTITLAEATLEDLGTNATIEIAYSATVDQDAVVGGTGNINTATLTYHGYTTAQVSAAVYTYQIGGEDADGDQIFKKIDGTTQEVLANVEFVLSKTVDETPNYAVLTEVTDSNTNTVTGYKLSGWTTTESEATAIKTNAEGGILVQGLDADTYTLTETKTLEGYNLLTYTITVTINDDGTVTYLKNDGTQTNPGGTITVENNTGTELPSTGGIGATIFYVVGSILVLGAAILLITRRRMNGSQA